MAYVYYHTVETYVNWQTAAYVTQDMSFQAQNIQVIEGIPSFPNFVATYLENNGTTPTYSGGTISGIASTANSKTTIEPGFEVMYAFRFYMHDTTNNRIFWLGSVKNNKAKYSTGGTAYDLNIVNNFAVTVANTSNMYNTYSSGYYTYNIVNGGSSKMGAVNNNGDIFKVFVKPKATAWTMSNGVTVNANITNNSSSGSGGPFLDPNTNTVRTTLLGITPSFPVSAKRSTPSIPSNLTTAVTLNSYPAVVNGGWNTNGYIYYDYCGMWSSSKASAPQFIGIKVMANATGGIANGTYTYTIYAASVNGASFTTLETKTETGNPSAPGPGLKAALTQARIIALGNCVSPGVATPTGQGNGSGVSTTTTPPTDESRYNPPPHIGARDISYGQRMKNSKNVIVQDPDALGAYYEAMAEPLINPMAVGYPNESKKTSNLGRVIQDTLSAKSMNKGSALWGFRFMYNPQTISYNTASDTSIDWTLGRKSPAVLLSGNQNVTVQLYINRIPDMAYLRDWLSPKHTGSLPMEQAYGRKLNDTEIQGILNRGTEYDIEFLYRVVNGDPQSKSLLFGHNYTGATSDFGYTTGVPVWMLLNDNMRYFGSVANIQVNHAMFNLDMVPILSTVTIGFTRYPALWNTDTATAVSQSALYGKDGVLQKGLPNIAGTADTPKKR